MRAIKDGGFASLDSNNIFCLNTSELENITGYNGGLVAISNLNIISVFKCEIKFINAVFYGGIIWGFQNNNVSFSTSIFFYLKSLGGSMNFLSKFNSFNFMENLVDNITSQE